MASPFPPRALDATFADNLGTEFVTIFVGPERKQYAVHKKLLTSQSDYFDKALCGGFREAEENSIHLEEDDPAAIALLIGWLYRGVIPGPAVQNVNIEGAFPPSTIDTILPTGGTSVPVEVYQEHDGHTGFPAVQNLSRFQSITAHPQYSKHSLEELRLADYKDGRQHGNLQDASAGLSATSSHSAPTSVGNPTFGAPYPSQWGPAPPQPSMFGHPQSASLFGNPRPTGASLFGPSSVASSGGIFVNLSTQTAPQAPNTGFSSYPSGGSIFGSSSTSARTQDALFGTPVSETQSAPTGGLFGNAPSRNPFGNPPAAVVPPGGSLTNWPISRTLPSPSTPSTSGRVQVGAPQSRPSLFGQMGSGSSSSSSTTTTTADGSDAVAVSTSTPQTSAAAFLAPRNQDGSLFVPTRATSSGVFANGNSNSDSTSQSIASSSVVIPTCQIGTTAQGQPAPIASTPNNSNTTALADTVRSALNIRGEANSNSSSSTATNLVSSEAANNENASSSVPQDRQTAPTGMPIIPMNVFSNAFSSMPTGVANPFGSTIASPFTHPTSQSFGTAAQVNTQPFFGSILPASSTWIPQHSNYRRFDQITNQSPFDTTYSTYTTPVHQLALLNLAVFAETTCWATLYNAAITSYINGERTLTRPPPLEHVTLIYERTHDESTLRKWSVDNLAAFKGDVDMRGYMGLLVDYEDFLEGVLKKLREKGQQYHEPSPGFDGAGGLKYRMLEHEQKKSFMGNGKGKGKASLREGSFDMKDF